MPQTSTDLSVVPYRDDFDIDHQYYRILFQPGEAVQVRELNVLQSMLQNQVRQFGDKMLSQGTIVSGCSFQFFDQYPYVKLRDNDAAGIPVAVANVKGFFAYSNVSGLKAFINEVEDGLESLNPNLKTLYVTYINAGNNNNTHVFSPGETITLTDPNQGIWGVTVVNPGTGFSNSDVPVFTPALIVNVTSGSFSNGQYVTQPSTAANLQIVQIDANTLSSANQIILYLKPRAADLANSLVNASAWAVANADSIRNVTNAAVADVLNVVGSGANGTVLTDGSGRVLEISFADKGLGYFYAPTVTIRSNNNLTGVTALSLTTQNYVTQVITSNTADSVGNGYAFGVTSGVIYQKGFFLRVEPQTIIIDRYDTSPNAISVGFSSSESIVTFRQDETLLDNAIITQNYQAPGADRLKIVPTLNTANLVTANDEFFPLVYWNDGHAVIVRQDTSYGEFEKELARREYETYGNFALDPFNIGTRSVSNSQLDANSFLVVVDPGQAYVQGYRTKTERNFVFSVPKGIDTNTYSTSFSCSYDYWIPIANVGGVFLFSTGDTVQLYDTPKGYIGNGSLVATGNIAPVGTQIGTARMHSMQIMDPPTAPPGDPSAQYRLYLYDIQMNQGQNFGSAQSVFYSGASANGVADIVLTLKSSTNTNICQFGNTIFKGLVFGTNLVPLEVANAVYIYRTIDQSATFANSGILTKTLTGTDYWPYTNSASLSNSQLQEMYTVPLVAIQAAANIPGTATVSTSSNVMTGSSSTFQSNLAVDDWIFIFSNSTVHDVRRVVSIANNTRIQLDANSTISKSGCGVYRYFPQYVPIPFGFRSGLTGNVDSTGQVLKLDLGMSLAPSTTSNAAVGCNIQRQNVAYGTKTANRNQWVVIRPSNNASGNTGPWCLGISDTIRLKRVAYFQGIAPPYTNNQLSANSHDVTGSFYIDQRQRADYIDLSYLGMRPDAPITFGTNDYLAVQLDAFQGGTAGFYVAPSYVTSNTTTIWNTDSVQLANLSSNVSSFEIPGYLAGAVDFRPIAANTATGTTDVGAAVINPTNTRSFGNTQNSANDLKLPRPDSVFSASITSWMGRVDAIVLGKDTNIIAVRGQPGAPLLPNVPGNSMPLGYLTIPPYPNLTENVSNTVGEVITTRTLHQNTRLPSLTIRGVKNANTVTSPQPTRYTKGALSLLDRRVRNLEYYAGLSALQTDMVNKVIPSGTDPTLNRFKFGFQVDNFSSGISQAYGDPQYHASIETGMLTPPMVHWAIRHGIFHSSPPYVDYLVINQPIASGPGSGPNPNTASKDLTWFLRVDADQVTTAISTDTRPVVNRVDLQTVTFANVAGTASFYWFVPATSASLSVETIVKLDPVQFYIYQGSTIIFTGYQNSTQLTGADITFLKSNAVPAAWFTTTELGTSFSRTASTLSVSGSGKIVWTHNPKLGNVYTIEAVRVADYDHWRYALSYTGAAPTIPAPQTLTSGVVSYTGVIKAQPSTFLLALAPPATLTSEGGGISAAGSLLVKLYRIVEMGGGMLGSGGGRIISDTIATTVDFAALTQSAWGVNETTGAMLQNYITTFRNRTGVELYDMNGAATIYNTALLSQGFRLVIYGLKPLTKHSLNVAGFDQTATCRPWGGKLGDSLMTDDTGFLVFDYFYYGSGYSQPITTQLLSNTSPISVSALQWLTGSEEVSVGDGSVTFEVSAPNSIARYRMQVAASPEIPLNLLRHPGSVG